MPDSAGPGSFTPCLHDFRTPACRSPDLRHNHRPTAAQIMDDAFHELTHGRMEIHSLLMLRPKTSRQPPTAQPAKRPHNPARPAKRPAPRQHKAEPPRKKGKGKGKGKTRDNWAASHQGKQICRRFQHGLCKSDTCQFAHVCAVKGCQQAHGAPLERMRISPANVALQLPPAAATYGSQTKHTTAGEQALPHVKGGFLLENCSPPHGPCNSLCN